MSVVMPVRDARHTLDAAVRSVLTSRGVELELVCVDDGSTDGSAEALERWAVADGRVRLVRREARGIVAALNEGLALARAPYVARMDADDEMHAERLRSQRDALRADPSLALVSCQVESTSRGRPLGEGYRRYTQWVNGLIEPEQIAREAFVECPVPHPTWMLPAAVFAKLGGYRDCEGPEDLDLVYRLLACGGRISKLARQLHRWLDHDQRLSRTDPRYGRDAFVRLKACHLAARVPMAGAVIWGAGRTGKRWVRALADVGLPVHALIDIDPRRVGRHWRGIPIYGPDALAHRAPGWRSASWRILGAVAARGARERIRAHLAGLDWTEGEDYWMVA